MAGPLSPVDAESLTSLWALLNEAIRRAGDPSTSGRRVAVVLLDGAVEACLGACLSYLGQAQQRTDRLDSLYSRLIELLGDRVVDRGQRRVRIAGWAEVKRLHEMRNLAQHHQVTPDHETLQRYGASCERFVRDAVGQTFGVDPGDVTLADGIEDPALAALFKDALSREAAGEYGPAVESYARALRHAQARFREQHRRTSPAGYVRVGGSSTWVEDHLDGFQEAAVFASDPGEVIWFRALLRDVGGERSILTEADALRCGAFVFGWIVRWEAFSMRFAAERPRRVVVPPASNYIDGRPHLRDAHLDVQLLREHRAPVGSETIWLTVPISIGDGTESGLPRWTLALERTLMTSADAPWTSATFDHRGSLRLATSDVDAISEVFNHLERVFAATRRAHADLLLAAEQEAERQRFVVDPIIATLSAMLDGDHRVFEGAEFVREMPAGVEFVRGRFNSTLTRAARRLVEDHALPPGGRLPAGSQLNGIELRVPLDLDAAAIEADVAHAVALITPYQDLIERERLDHDERFTSIERTARQIFVAHLGR